MEIIQNKSGFLFFVVALKSLAKLRVLATLWSKCCAIILKSSNLIGDVLETFDLSTFDLSMNESDSGLPPFSLVSVIFSVLLFAFSITIPAAIFSFVFGGYQQ